MNEQNATITADGPDGPFPGDELTIQDYDGALINTETGEVVGYAGSPFVLPPLDPALTASLSREEVMKRKAEREEQLKAAVLWATERRANAEAKLGGVTTEKNLLIAGVNERFETMIAEQNRKIKWIDDTYGPAMREFTKSQLEGGKSKSVKLPWATLGYRASKGALEVTDAPTAAFTIIEADGASAVQLTINVGELHAAALKDRDGAADMLLSALMEAFDVKFTEKGEAENVQEIDHVELVPGMTASIIAGQVPDALPEGVLGMERKPNEDPLGKFYVSHK